MRANELIELGWRVCGELVDEDNKKYLFVVEDDEGNWMVLHYARYVIISSYLIQCLR